MADAGFFKGTSAEQDSRFANKQKKLLKQMKFPDNIDVKIDMLKVKLDVLKSWITKRLQELLGIEDDVVIEFVFNQLEDKNPDPKMMQINLTGFLGGSKARLFIGELWKHLASAQSSPDGIPAEFVEMKKRELLKRMEEDDRLRDIRKREEETHRQDIKPDIEKLDNKLNGRNLMTSSNNKLRNDNHGSGEYKSRPHYESGRRRSPPKNRRQRDSRSPDLRSRHNEKKPIQTVEKDEKPSSNRNDRHRSPSKSPIHSRSSIKSSRKNDEYQHHSSSSSSESTNKKSLKITKQPETIKPKSKARLSSSSSDASDSHQRIHKSSRRKSVEILNDSNEIKRSKIDDQLKKLSVSKTKRKSPSPLRSKQPTKSTSKPDLKPKISTVKETKKPKKRDRTSSSKSSSASRSNSNSSSLSSMSNSAKKKKKKSQVTKSSSSSRSPSLDRNRKSDKKKDDHKSRKHSTHHNSKSSSRKRTKNHRSSDSKRKSHRDHLDKSITRKPHRSDSAKKLKKDKNQHKAEKKDSNSYQSISTNEIPVPSSPKRPRLESQIKEKTPPIKLPDNNKFQQLSAPIKPTRTERIVVLEESRIDATDSVSTHVCIAAKSTDHEIKHQNNSQSEDENEIDLRERLLREKAIKSMRRRQLTTTTTNNNNTDVHTKTTNDRIVYESQ
ncbi:unnamed protein product [Rotaria magnacalcarata]|uniref:PWI domain-containing protein n=1 Tax=Rotaria magnacalcarata TaxID=392030 RepID=A0A816NFQ9_9BILA|nr:unnamed protein product [Rotaria magnacalcarata]